MVDCWCLLGSDAALLECSTTAASRGRRPGLSVFTDADPPRYPKLHVVLAAAGITRAAAEDAMERFVDLGFPDGHRFPVRPGKKITLDNDYGR